MRVIAYVRVSTEEQAGSGLGLLAQRKAITDEADRRGWDVTWVEDAGLSAGSLDRPGLAHARQMLAAGKADGLVVSKLDRLSRSMLDFATVMDEASKQKWSLITLDLGVDMTTPSGQLLANVFAAFASFERELIRQRTRDALAAAKARGQRLGRPRATPDAVVARVLALSATLSPAQVARALTCRRHTHDAGCSRVASINRSPAHPRSRPGPTLHRFAGISRRAIDMSTTKERQSTRTAGVYKKARQRGLVYEVRYRTKEGRQVGKTFGTLEEAEAFLLEQKHEVHLGTHVTKAAASTPWATVAEQWMVSKRIAGKKARTLKGYQHILDSWCAGWAQWGIGSIKTADVQALVARMVEEGRSPQTVRNVFNVVRGVFDYALNVGGYTNQNPALALSRRLPARSSSHSARFLTGAQVNILANEMDVASGLLVRFAAWSGLRAGEIAGLRVRNVDVLRAKVRVLETVIALKGELRSDTPKSKKSQREVPIPPALARMLSAHVADGGLRPEDYLFGSGSMPLNHGKWYLSTFVPATKRAALAPMRFHDLRHTYASLMHAQGRSLLEVSRWMGHSTYAITADIYSHVWEDEDGSLGAALDAAFGAAAASAPPMTVVPLAKVAR